MSLIVGIDLGTTYSVMAYIDPQSRKPAIIKNKYGSNTTPSVIGFRADGSYVIGEDAKNMEEAGDVNTASFYKIHMGDQNYKISIYGKQYTARDLSALFLKCLVKEAEETMGDSIKHAVITVPAYFEDAARDDTLKAGEAAGLHVMNIISEPTAACVAYGLNADGKERKILIYDLGGGTFDVTIAGVKRKAIDVLATNGLHQLGGRDWDKAVAEWLASRFQEETGVDISEDNELSATNMVKAEKAKKQLSSANSAEVTVDDGNQKCKFRLTREEFESITSYQLVLTTDLIDQTMEEIGIGWEDLEGAVLVGGSTRMPMVRKYIQDKHVTILEGVHPDEAVAVGAAIQANISRYCALEAADKEKSSMALLDRTEKMDLQLLPGAAIIRDVISHSLGMIMSNEDETRFINDIMIRRNTPFNEANTTKRRELRVVRNKANNTLDIYLLQGESNEPIDCSVAKRYVFYDIDFVAGGRSLIDITFSHTYNGTIDVRAVQTETGKALSFRTEEIPEDMSWVTRSPRELMAEQKQKIQGTLVMALDVSGSMAGIPVIQAKTAMNNFVDQFEGMGIRIGIFAFSDAVAATCMPTEDMEVVHQAINAIAVCDIKDLAPINAQKHLGYGNAASPLGVMFDALETTCGNSQGARQKQEEKRIKDSFARIAALQNKEIRKEAKLANTNQKSSGFGQFMYAIVLTDGEWNMNACNEARSKKADFVRKGYEIIGMGFGTADLDFLKEISTRDELASVDDIGSLNEKLSSIARVISE